ncbi:MAG: amidohydrolase family protein [Longimicrobiales bacterium]
MNRRTLVELTLGLALLALPPVQLASQETEGPDTLALIRNVTVIDGTGSPGRPGLDVVIRHGLIDAVRPATENADFDGPVIDGSDRFLVPGLIDAHVHLSGSTRDDTAQLLAWVLEGGVTSLRDMAGDARTLAGIGEALISGELTGPSLYYSALVAGPAFLSDPRLEAATVGYEPGAAPYMIPATADTDLAQALAMAKGTGATGVKLYAALDADLVRRVTDEAHRVGLQVWAHSAVFPAKPVEVLDAGVDGVSHAPYVIWEADPPTPDFTLRAQGDFERIAADGPEMGRVIEAMVRNATVLDPTLFVFDREDSSDNAALRLAWGGAFTRRALRAGVTIAAGTDGVGRPLAGELPNVHREMELLVQVAGFTPLEAVVAATHGGARAIGAADQIGRIEPGMTADLVLLSEDPEQDIRNTRSIVHVFQRGRLVR